MAGTEIDTLVDALERNRRTFAWKTEGLDRNGLAQTTAASTMTLGGLVKHLALVEADWLAVKLAGEEYGAPWDAVDFDADPEWEWRTGAEDEPAEVDGPASFTWPDGSTPTVRAMLVDLVEEYARHTGHADLLREAVDGRVGEGAPKDFSSP